VEQPPCAHSWFRCRTPSCCWAHDMTRRCSEGGILFRSNTTLPKLYAHTYNRIKWHRGLPIPTKSYPVQVLRSYAFDFDPIDCLAHAAAPRPVGRRGPNEPLLTAQPPPNSPPPECRPLRTAHYMSAYNYTIVRKPFIPSHPARSTIPRPPPLFRCVEIPISLVPTTASPLLPFLGPPFSRRTLFFQGALAL
jgi:hypothetical protein